MFTTKFSIIKREEVSGMRAKKVTIKDVAKESGVSIATVSQILNGNTQNFSTKTVAKVLKIKDTLNYEPDYFARRMIIKKSKTIGVLVPDITNPFFNQLIRGIEDSLYKENFVTMLCNADLDKTREIKALEELGRRSVDGLIIATPNVSNEQIHKIVQNQKIPYIVLDQKKADPNGSDAILTDDFTGGYLAASHLKELGHEQVAVVMPTKAAENIQRRLAGFQSVYGTSCKVILTELSKKGGKDAVPQIMQTNVTAIFAINDELAFGIYLGLSQSNKKIPEDYSVIGYDNVDMCEYVTPQLTTIAQPIFELGQVTAQLLLERIQFPEKNWEEKKLPVKLMKRFSTAYLK